jgi:uncharacterized membrane protein
MEYSIGVSIMILVLHFGVAGTRLRDAIVRAIGEGPYLGLFSLASLAGVFLMAAAYNGASAGENALIWDLGPGAAHLGIIVVGLAFLLGIAGVLTPNPTMAMQGDSLLQPAPATGILRITRHPFLWAVALWAAFHLAANGDRASIVFFGTWLILAIGGTFSIDGKRARKYGDAWDGFARRTSNLPFLAVLEGRQSLPLGEFLTWRLAVAVGIFLVFLFVHAWLFGVSPFPGGWRPF